MDADTNTAKSLRIRVVLSHHDASRESAPKEISEPERKLSLARLGLFFAVVALVVGAIYFAFKNDADDIASVKATPPMSADSTLTPHDESVPAATISNDVAGAPSSMTDASAAAAKTDSQDAARNAVAVEFLSEDALGKKPEIPRGATVPAADVTKRFFYFTEVHDMQGHAFAHVWEYNGKRVARITFKSGGSVWKGSSNKKIPSHMQGAWRAVLLDARDHEISSISFTYGAASAASH